MNPNEYQNLAERTECDNVLTRYNLYVERMATRLFHAALGLSTEVGEFNDTLKKWIYYQQELDQPNLEEELGDILWYIALACNALGISLEDVMEKNIAKLKIRYPEKYEDVLAAEENRDRDAERNTLMVSCSNCQRLLHNATSLIECCFEGCLRVGCANCFFVYCSFDGAWICEGCRRKK